MDMLVLGNSGTGKTFLISLIHQMFLANGIVTHPRIKKVDASEYNQWIGALNEKTLDELQGCLLVIDNAHLLMTDTEHLTPIDRLFSMMEDWERDLSANWHTYPIVIFEGEKNQIEYYFQKKKSGRSRLRRYSNSTTAHPRSCLPSVSGNSPVADSPWRVRPTGSCSATSVIW
jgi:hypothetical protein